MSRTILFHSMWDIKLKATNKQDKQTNKNSQTQTTLWQLPEGKGIGGHGQVRVVGAKDIVTEDWTWGGRHTVQYTHDVPLNSTLETYITLLTNDTPIDLIKS